MEFNPEYARVQNAFRFFMEESVMEKRTLAFLTVDLLLGLFHLKREDFLAVMDYPKKGYFYVTFCSKEVFLSVLRQTEEKITDPSEGVSAFCRRGENVDDQDVFFLCKGGEY